MAAAAGLWALPGTALAALVPAGTAASAIAAQDPVSVTSTTTLIASPAAAVTDQPITLIATVTSAGPSSPPSGSLDLRSDGADIPGCTGLAVQAAAQSATVTCQTAFLSGSYALTASFSPSTGSVLSASSSAATTLTVGIAPSTTSLVVASEVDYDTPTTYTAIVSAPEGSVQLLGPSGTVSFLAGDTTICASRLLISMVATCTVRYHSLGAEEITAVYGGDSDFAPSASSLVPVTVVPIPPIGFVDAYVSWTFVYTPKYTTVGSLIVSGVHAGISIAVACHGHGCPFAQRTTSVQPAPTCAVDRTRACQTSGTIDLTPSFRSRHLGVGAQVTVSIEHPLWLGKYYRFTVRSAREPQVTESCLAVDMIEPGVGCSSG
ncbi:MAG: Ig-like domain-containing protein [Solirubrobacteraceae bacterium]